MSSSGIPTELAKKRPRVAIIGGSGMCTFPELTELYRVRPETSYGLPSDHVRVCEYDGELVAFLPRHGESHSLAPHKVPYKANLAALKDLGVETVFATCIVGSLKEEIPPGSLIIPDQFVNLTWGRDDQTESDMGRFIHLPMADPYCDTTRTTIIRAVEECGLSPVKKGTVVVIQGPRFSTRAESRFFIQNGWDIVNMTQYPECYFARELGLCYGALATVTDFDVGIPSQVAMEPKHMERVLQVFNQNIEKTKTVLLKLVSSCSTQLPCSCSRAIVRTYYEQE